MSQPNIIIDIIFDKGVLFIAVQNIGDASACNISVTFDRKINGRGGERVISELALFENIAFMPPGKEIKTFWDTASSYFDREEPTGFSTTIEFEDRKGREYTNEISHSAAIYKDISYLVE